MAVPDRAELGLAGERLAARALRRAGYRVLGRRVRTPWAEVDLLVERGGALACVEVKAGRRAEGTVAPRWRPADHLRPRALRRQLRAARWLAARRGVADARLLLVEVLVGGGGTLIEVRVLAPGNAPASHPRNAGARGGFSWKPPAGR